MSTWQTLGFTALAYLLFTVARGVYNWYLHPLAKVPGPRWAAFSPWWKTNLEVIQKCDMIEVLYGLHAIYGDVVRIGPNELHFSKPSAYHEIYNPRNRWSKDPALYHVFSDYESLLTIMDYPSAKKRKDILQPLFSRKSILSLSHLVQECADQMCTNMTEHAKEGRSVDFTLSYKCFALDGISSYCFGKSLDATKVKGFNSSIVESLHFALPLLPPLRHFRLVKKMIDRLPVGLMSMLNPNLKGRAVFLGMLHTQVKGILANPEVLKTAPHPTIFHELMSGRNGAPVLKPIALEDEAQLMVVAGTDTSSNTLTIATAHVLDNPKIEARLRDELQNAWPTLDETPRYEDLEKLPYLKAVLKEGLRLGHGVWAPMSRIVPQDGAVIGGTYIPGGTSVGQSNLFVHLDPELFPEPHSFKPERWLNGKTEDGELLDHWLVTFGKGPRSCLGINLGWCNMITAMASVFRRFDMELDGASTSDMKWREYYVPVYLGKPLKLKARSRTD